MRKRLRKKLAKETAFLLGQRIPPELSDRLLADLNHRAVESCLTPPEPFVLEMLPATNKAGPSFLRLMETMSRSPLPVVFVNPSHLRDNEESLI